MTKPLDILVDNIPDELKARRQWLGYKPVWHPNAGKFRKQLVQKKWGERQYWRTFDEVIDAGQRPGLIYADGVERMAPYAPKIAALRRLQREFQQLREHSFAPRLQRCWRQ